MFQKLIVAKLVDNPNFEKMYLAFRERWFGWLAGELGELSEDDTKRIKNSIMVLDKVYKDLKNIKPIV